MRINRVRFSFTLLTALLLPVLPVSAGEQPTAKVANTDSVGPRTLEDQTRAAVIRDYLEAWQVMHRAFGENDASLLDTEFTGIAKDKFSDTIKDQQKLGLRTEYSDRSHDIKLVFYSPEALSIQLLDTVEYDVQLLDHERAVATQHVRAQYVAVMTPTEVRWKVRLLQAAPVADTFDPQDFPDNAPVRPRHQKQ